MPWLHTLWEHLTSVLSASMLRKMGARPWWTTTLTGADASIPAVSEILSQKTEDKWYPIAFWSRKLTDAETRWATGQQELLAIIESLEPWQHYLHGMSQKFAVLTDHQTLKGLVNASARDLRGRLARWVYRLSSFDFDISHRPGTTNPAGGLSRRPEYMGGRSHMRMS